MTPAMSSRPELGQRIQRRINSALKSRLVTRLTYPHGIDRYLENLNPTWSVHTVRATVMHVHSQTPDTVTVQLRPNHLWQGFQPGQYLRLTLSIDGVRHTRCFSPANSQHATDGLIELTAKLHAKALMTRYMRDDLSVGDVVELSQADGEFALPVERPERVLLISGGSGITPVMSMLRTLCDEDYAGYVTFLHYANTEADQLYAQELIDLATQYPRVELIRCYAQPEQGGELQGLFNAEQLLDAVPDFAEAQTFLCGPPGLMAAVEQVYVKNGLVDRLHQERFSAAPAVLESAHAEGDVRFARSERMEANDGRVLLDQAEAAGLNPESGCRMGVCYACTCRKLSGQVRDTRTGQLSDSGEQDIQICVSVPVGTVTLDI